MLLTSSLLCSCFVIQVVSCNSSYRWYKIELMFSLTDVLNVFGFALIHTFLTTEKTKLCFDNYQDYRQKTKLVRGTIQRKQSQERRGVQSGVCVVDFFFFPYRKTKQTCKTKLKTFSTVNKSCFFNYCQIFINHIQDTWVCVCGYLLF